MNPTRLERCPFCGHKAKVSMIITMHEYVEYLVACDNPHCPIRPYALNNDPKQVIEDWNSRK